MAAYHKVEVSLNTNAVEVGIPSPQTVNVTLPTIGPAGPAGATGATGATGAAGQGVPVGGTTGQVLRKASGTNYDTEWATGGGGVSSWNDLTDKPATFAPSAHTHTGAQVTVGTTANLPLKTGTNGVIEAGSFSNTAGSYCEGNDARLSDDRDPNLHAASHLPDGADELFDQDLNTTDDVQFASVNSKLTSGGFDNLTITNGQNAILAIDNTNAAAFALSLIDTDDNNATVGQVLVGLRNGTEAFLQNGSPENNDLFRMEKSGGNLADLIVRKLKLGDDTYVATIETNISSNVTLTIANRSGTNVVSDTSAGTGSDVVNNIVSLTQAEYAAIGSPDAATLYLITDP
jgi:hypothetical protein